MRATIKHKEPIQEEEEGKRDFPSSYTQVKEENVQINEEKTLEWMDVEITNK